MPHGKGPAWCLSHCYPHLLGILNAGTSDGPFDVPKLLIILNHAITLSAGQPFFLLSSDGESSHPVIAFGRGLPQQINSSLAQIWEVAFGTTVLWEVMFSLALLFLCLLVGLKSKSVTKDVRYQMSDITKEVHSTVFLK